jgi:hypothetical protein
VRSLGVKAISERVNYRRHRLDCQYIEAHIPSKTNAFTNKLTIIAAQTSNLLDEEIGSNRPRFTNKTIAIMVVTGAIDKNHSVKISAKFR